MDEKYYTDPTCYFILDLFIDFTYMYDLGAKLHLLVTHQYLLFLGWQELKLV